MPPCANVACYGELSYGDYVGDLASCGSSDGWFYVEPEDLDHLRRVPTFFSICPKTCAAVTDGGAPSAGCGNVRRAGALS